MYASKIFAEFMVLMAIFNVDFFQCEFLRQLSFLFSAGFLSDLHLSWFLKGELVKISDSFPIVLLLCCPFLLGCGTQCLSTRGIGVLCGSLSDKAGL